MRAFHAAFLLVIVLVCLALAGEPARAAPTTTLSLGVSNPYCTRTVADSGTCFINLRSVSATASDTSFSHLEITVNGKVRVYMTGFFETSATLGAAMLGNGLQVTCGRPNASGNPDFGLQYQVGIAANLYGSLPINDFATVTCPYYEARIFLPAVRK